MRRSRFSDEEVEKILKEVAGGLRPSVVCQANGISVQTFYRWKRRYSPEHLETLEGRSHRPRRVRQPTYSVELVEAVVKLREEYPRWGKDKLEILLQRQGYRVSAAWYQTIHLTATLPEAKWWCGACPSDPYGGVLRGDR